MIDVSKQIKHLEFLMNGIIRKAKVYTLIIIMLDYFRNYSHEYIEIIFFCNGTCGCDMLISRIPCRDTHAPQRTYK